MEPTKDKAPEEEKPLPKAALMEPKTNNASPKGSGDSGGEGPLQPEVKPPSKRPPAAEPPKPSAKKAKSSSNGVDTIPDTSPQASSHTEKEPGKEEQPEAKAEQAKPESEPEALKKPPESAPSGPSSSDSGSKPFQSYSQGALLFGKPRHIPTVSEFSFRLDQAKDFDKSKDGGQSSTKKLDSMELGEPPTKLWHSEGDGEKGSLLKTSEEPDSRCVPAATKLSFHVDQDKYFGKSKDGSQSSTKKFDSLEPAEPPAKLWPSEGDGKKGSLPKMSKEPEARHIPTAAQFSFRVNWDKDFSKSKDGESSTKKLDNMEPGESPAELQNSGDSEKENLLKMSKEPEARHITTTAKCSFETGQDRDIGRSNDGGQSSTKKLDIMEPGEAPAELQNSGGDSEKESLPKMSTEPEAWFEENLNKKPKEDILCSRKKMDKECFFGPLRGFPDDIKKYMATKPPDLGDSCIHFSQFGKCQYWVTCRFAGAHLGEGYQNVVNEELWKKWEGKSAVRNMLMIPDSGNKILRDFPFTKSSDYLSCLKKAKNKAAAPGKKKVPPYSTLKTVGVLTDEDLIRLRPCEKRKLDLQGKLYLSPLAKCGSLPFRRICKRFGADITCGGMLCCVLSKDQMPGVTPCLHRHETEDLFGIQLQGTAPTPMIRYGELLNETSQVDFVDINAEYLESATLMKRSIHFEQIVRGMDYVLDVPLTVKLRTGIKNTSRLAHTLIPKLRDWGVSMVTLHGRSAEDMYKNLADWEYIGECAKVAAPMPLFGNGDIYSFEDAARAMETGISGIAIARAALIKPWIFTEIKERRHWDISARERLDMLKDFTNYGLEYWGSDMIGVEKTRHSLLNWLSFLCRYIPVGLLEHLPPKMTDQHPGILYGDYLENLMSSQMIKDWVKIRYLSTKEEFHAYLDREGELQSGEDGEKDEPEKKAGSDLSEPPPAKFQKLEEDGNQEENLPEVGNENKNKQERKRARGQNKSRPCMKPANYEKNRLCPSVVQERTDKCFFGSRCRFLHDVKEYMATKAPDLGDSCVLFKTFGKCIYGATCRFAGSHFGDDFKNIVDTDLQKQWEGKAVVKNSLNKELQQQLRKKKFPFDKSQEYLRHLSKTSRTAGSGSKASVKETGIPNCTSSEESVDPKPSNVEVLDITLLSQNEKSSLLTMENSDHLAVLEKPVLQRSGTVTDEDVVKLRPCEKRKLDLNGKLYLAPLTTCGNLPFRRICKRYGADVTCGEMAVCTNLLQGQSSEWALLKRHHTEDLFGVQLEGAFPDTMTKCAELLNRTIEVDFVDINVGCPIDLIYNKGGGCALMTRTNKFEQIVRGMNYVLDVPLTVKIRTGVQEKTNLAHKIIPSLREWGAALVTLHGRSREQRYTKVADWEYIAECAKIASPIPLFGNGDIFSFDDANRAMETGVSGIMIARGALIKPWIFTEIKERRHWDISSSERFEILKDYTNYGLEHWGSDTQGVEKTRKFLLEWLSFLCRYIPAGLLERLPQRINERPPYYMGRDYMETLMASQNVGDWIKISEMLLGPVPTNFTFLPKHKANSYK